MFLIYINGIDICAKPIQGTGGLRLFADDAKFFSSNPSNLQSSLNLLTNWLQDYQLRLAKEKCSVVSIPQSSSNPYFFLENSQILTSESIKDLGIIISDNLKWNKHIDYLYRNASVSSYQISKFSKTKNIWTLIKLFKTYVRPKLEFNTPIWSPYLSKDIEKIEKIQKTFTRYIFKKLNLPYSSYSDRLRQINLKSLEYRRLFFDLVFLYKIINGLAGINFHDYFVIKENPYMLRENQFKIESNFKSFNSIWHNSFFTRASKLWNSLPKTITDSKSLISFKKTLNKFNLCSIAPLRFQ